MRRIGGRHFPASRQGAASVISAPLRYSALRIVRASIVRPYLSTPICVIFQLVGLTTESHRWLPRSSLCFPLDFLPQGFT